jgi:hypothetical protein
MVVERRAHRHSILCFFFFFFHTKGEQGMNGERRRAPFSEDPNFFESLETAWKDAKHSTPPIWRLSLDSGQRLPKQRVRPSRVQSASVGKEIEFRTKTTPKKKHQNTIALSFL